MYLRKIINLMYSLELIQHKYDMNILFICKPFRKNKCKFQQQALIWFCFIEFIEYRMNRFYSRIAVSVSYFFDKTINIKIRDYIYVVQEPA